MYSVLSEFFQCQVTGEEKAKRQAMRACMYPVRIVLTSRLTTTLAQRAFENTPSLYLLSLKEMIENDYPIPSYMADVFEKGPGWIETPQASEESILLLPTETRQSKIYAIDCEMVSDCITRGGWSPTLSQNQCLTEDGKELTRACMIDYETGIVVYDKLVKPPKPVIDYMTR